MGLKNMTKTEENRLRRSAARQGLRLERCRYRDPRALGYGTYRLVDSTTYEFVATGRQSGTDYGLTLNEIDSFLVGKPLPTVLVFDET